MKASEIFHVGQRVFHRRRHEYGRVAEFDQGDPDAVWVTFDGTDDPERVSAILLNTAL